MDSIKSEIKVNPLYCAGQTVIFQGTIKETNPMLCNVNGELVLKWGYSISVPNVNQLIVIPESQVNLIPENEVKNEEC